jgi:hypothetical protein
MEVMGEERSGGEEEGGEAAMRRRVLQLQQQRGVDVRIAPLGSKAEKRLQRRAPLLLPEQTDRMVLEGMLGWSATHFARRGAVVTTGLELHSLDAEVDGQPGRMQREMTLQAAM